MTAFIQFANDPSVGIFSETFSIELPLNEFDSPEIREECREEIKKFYSTWNGEFNVSSVTFSDEEQD
jgi:hypothetical protein